MEKMIPTAATTLGLCPVATVLPGVQELNRLEDVMEVEGFWALFL